MTDTAEPQKLVDYSDRIAILKSKMLESRESLLGTLKNLTPEQLAKPSVNEGWTIFDMAAHVAGAEGGMVNLAKSIIAGQAGPLPDFDLNRYNAGRINKRQGKTIAELISELEDSRLVLNRIIDAASTEQLDLTGYHPVEGDVTIYKLCEVISEHEKAHTLDIKFALGLV